MGVFNKVDRDNLARAIVNITGGERVLTLWFAQVVVREPDKFRGKDVEEDKQILQNLIQEIKARKKQ